MSSAVAEQPSAAAAAATDDAEAAQAAPVAALAQTATAEDVSAAEAAAGSGNAGINNGDAGQPATAAAAAGAAPPSATDSGGDGGEDPAATAATTTTTTAPPAPQQQAQQQPQKPQKQTKRKVAVHLAYLGAGFAGMQRNPGARTIEGELEAALVKAGAISQQNAGSFQKIHWNRAARTDKGVSALCQVVSAKLMVEPRDTFAERVNAHLPQQVRVFGVQRATEGFDARKFCDKRQYEYILPAWAFDPLAAAHGRTATTTTVTAAAGNTAAAAAGRGGGSSSSKQARSKVAQKGSSSARLADEAAALQAIAAAVLAAPAPQDCNNMPKSAAAAAAAAAGGGGDDNANTSDQPSSGGGDGVSSNKQQQQQQQQQKEPPGGGCDELASTSKVGADVLRRLRDDISVSRQRHVFGDSQLQRLNGLLKQYEGTHNFHNLTVRVSWDDPAACRYILSFAAEHLTIGGQPWVKLVVVGQSFMLHQIRKMVGLVLAIMRGAAPDGCIQLALDPDRDLLTPMAPELGLFLDETFYEAYNHRFGELHGPISFEPHRQAAADFKHNILYNHIAALDERELVNALWLRGCTDSYFRFSSWSSQPKARDSSASKQQQQQQQQQTNGADSNKRKQQSADPAGGGSSSQQQQQQQSELEQQPLKQQRLERPDKLQGASAAMVVGMQETYGMRPHSDTQQAAEQRRELKEMREEYAAAAQSQQQQQQQPPPPSQQQQQPQVAAAAAGAEQPQQALPPQQDAARGTDQQHQQQQQQQQQPKEVVVVDTVDSEELDCLYE